MHRHILMLTTLAALAAGACQTSDDTSKPGDPAELTPPAPVQAILAEHETLSYRGTIHTWQDGRITQTLPVAPLTAEIEAIGQHRRITIDGSDQIRGEILTDAAGRIDAGQARFPTGLDLVEQLPPPGVDVAIGVEYVSQPPPIAYVRANADDGKMTMTDAVHSTPIAIWTLPSGDTVVRLATEARHRISFTDDDDAGIRSIEIGVAYVGVTDLAETPGGDWRMLRTTRLFPQDEAPTGVAIDKVRENPHAEFTACAVDSTRVDVRTLHRAVASDIPEFAECNR